MPFADYKDFQDCVNRNREKKDPKAYCASIEHATKLAASRLLKAEEPRRYTLGVVYEPDVEDLQGDAANAEEIEKAAWKFMRSLQGRTVTRKALEIVGALVRKADNGPVRVDITDVWEELDKAGLGDMHSEWPDGLGDVVESYIAPADMVVNGEVVQKGSWMLGVVWSPDYFEKIRAGKRTGYSMGGRGRREMAHA